MNPSHVEIRHIRGQHDFGRAILYGQLYSPTEDKIITQRASIAQILQFVNTNKLIITNAQEVLHTLVIENGFAS